jgi:hypothetical protein
MENNEVETRKLENQVTGQEDELSVEQFEALSDDAIMTYYVPQEPELVARTFKIYFLVHLMKGESKWDSYMSALQEMLMLALKTMMSGIGGGAGLEGLVNKDMMPSQDEKPRMNPFSDTSSLFDFGSN